MSEPVDLPKLLNVEDMLNEGSEFHDDQDVHEDVSIVEDDDEITDLEHELGGSYCCSHRCPPHE